MHCRLANHHTQTTDEPQVQISQVLTTYNGGSLIVEASVVRARVHCGGRRRCRPCIGPEHGAGLREPAQLAARGRGRRERDLERHGGGVRAELREPARGRLSAGALWRPLRGEPLLGLGGLRVGGGWRRSSTTTTPPTPAPRRPASRAATTRRWCGAPPRPSAAPASSAATTPASSSSAITTHQATSLGRTLTSK